MSMKILILSLGMMIGIAMDCKAQITASNPLEWMALAEGNELLEKQIDSQINGQKKQPYCKIPLQQSSIKCTNGRNNTTAI